MIDASRPPSGSVIEVSDSTAGRRYQWRSPSRHPMQWFVVIFGLFFVFGSVICFVVMTFADPDPKPPPEMIVAMCGFQLLTGLACLWCGLARGRPESVVLSDSGFHYDTGSAFLPAPMGFFFWPMLLQGQGWFGGMSGTPIRFRRRQYGVLRKEVAAFVLSRVGERQRLTVDIGADRIEIGASLREPEREWLAAALQSWQDAT